MAQHSFGLCWNLSRALLESFPVVPFGCRISRLPTLSIKYLGLFEVLYELFILLIEVSREKRSFVKIIELYTAHCLFTYSFLFLASMEESGVHAWYVMGLVNSAGAASKGQYNVMFFSGEVI